MLRGKGESEKEFLWGKANNKTIGLRPM